jgi:hypothetical protein
VLFDSGGIQRSRAGYLVDPVFAEESPQIWVSLRHNGRSEKAPLRVVGVRVAAQANAALSCDHVADVAVNVDAMLADCARDVLQRFPIQVVGRRSRPRRLVGRGRQATFGSNGMSLSRNARA